MYLTADRRVPIAQKAPHFLDLLDAAETPEGNAKALQGKPLLIQFAAGFDPLSGRNRHNRSLPYLASLQRTNMDGQYLLPEITLEGLVALCQSPHVASVEAARDMVVSTTPWRGR